MLSAVILQVAQVTYVHTHTHTHTKNPTHQPLIPTVSNSSTYAFQECMYLCVWQIIHLRQSYTHTHTHIHTHTHTHTHTHPTHSYPPPRTHQLIHTHTHTHIDTHAHTHS